MIFTRAFCNTRNEFQMEKTALLIDGSRYSRMDQVKVLEARLLKIWKGMICFDRYHFKFFKGCVPQILLGPLLNTFIRISYHNNDDD